MVKSAFSNCLLLLAAFAFSCKPEKEVKKPIIHPQLIPHLNQANKPFPFGVASGDPQLNSLVIWTKYLADSSQLDSTIRIDWELSANREFSKIFDKGTINTNRHKDFTVKANVEGLEANSTYYYRFRVGSTYSEIGEGKTLGNQEGYKVAFVSCSNYEWGYFNAYRLIAQDSTIDLVVHLGDYIYEYGIGKYGDTTINRLNVPEYEIISLDDYRTRYALYRLDPDLKLLHQKKSMINIWDDHELANNAYMTGAQNHDSTEGDWTKRKAAAAQAFHEWLPIQHPNTLPIYRNFKGGSLFNLLALDTRLAGRTVQVENPASANFSDSSRAILGKDQFNWMQNQLQGEQRWNIVANQVPFGPMKFVGKDGPELYMDGWDGYPYEREKMLQFLENIELKNTVFVTGDFHRAFVLENDL
ncbi:MAG: alkaline phosphatase D family protein, partial [Luteibaculum sp.]